MGIGLAARWAGPARAGEGERSGRTLATRERRVNLGVLSVTPRGLAPFPFDERDETLVPLSDLVEIPWASTCASAAGKEDVDAGVVLLYKEFGARG